MQKRHESTHAEWKSRRNPWNPYGIPRIGLFEDEHHFEAEERRLRGLVEHGHPFSEPDDERLRANVCELLENALGTDERDVRVAVWGGEVILSGRARNEDSRRVIEEVVWHVPGVERVRNQLQVRSQSGFVNNLLMRLSRTLPW